MGLTSDQMQGKTSMDPSWLAILQRIVRRHSGVVDAKGIPGQGATFWFSLPAKIGTV